MRVRGRKVGDGTVTLVIWVRVTWCSDAVVSPGDMVCRMPGPGKGGAGHR